MTPERLRIEFAVADFFAIPLKRVEIESVRETGRTYFIHRGAIVAVARKGEIDGTPTAMPVRIRSVSGSAA